MLVREFLKKLFLFGIAFYILNIGVLFLIHKSATSSFHTMHLFILAISSFALVVLARLFKKNKDIVGMSFLLVSTIQTLIIFIFGKWLLDADDVFNKWNYFILFISYLFLETAIVGSRLNKTKF